MRRAPLCALVLAWAGCTAGAPGGSDLGPCFPDPTDCAGRCGQVTDRCGAQVSCGSCGDGGAHDGPAGNDDLAGASGSDLAAADSATGGVTCTTSSIYQCSCFNSAQAGGPQSCNAAQFGNGICCATNNYPGASNSGCFCEVWGCSASSTAGGSCICGLGSWVATSCTPGTNALCCAGQDSPSCNCTVGLASCPSRTTPVSRCDSSTFACGSGYSFPQTVSACN